MAGNQPPTQHASPIRILSFDEQIVAREGLKKVLEGSRIQVSGATGTLAELLQKLEKSAVDVLLVEPSRNGNRDRNILEEILEHHPNARILVYSVHEGLPFIAAAYETGAKGFVTKTSSRQTLIDAAVAVAQGDTYFMPGFSEKIAIYVTSRRHKTDPKKKLNSREITIFTMLARGDSTHEIANALSVHVKVVQNIAVTIKHKLGVPRANFLRVALDYDLVG